MTQYAPSRRFPPASLGVVGLIPFAANGEAQNARPWGLVA
jgi:hypothetical protein